MQEVKKGLLKALSGRDNVFFLNIKGCINRGEVHFGEFRLPASITPPDDKLAELEKIYDCRIKRYYSYTGITPNLVKKRIETDGFIASDDDELLKDLYKWAKTNFNDLVTDFLKLSGGLNEEGSLLEKAGVPD